MSDDCPPFLVVLVYLFSFILASSIIGYIFVWIGAWEITTPPLFTAPYFAALGLINLNCCYNIYELLFSARARR
jgi:hypothetical protein